MTLGVTQSEGEVLENRNCNRDLSHKDTRGEGYLYQCGSRRASEVDAALRANDLVVMIPSSFFPRSHPLPLAFPPSHSLVADPEAFNGRP